MTLQLEQPQTKRWTREEYYRLADEGWFRGQRVQLIDGEIIQMPPQGHPHARAIAVLTRWLHDTYNNDFMIRIQMPLNVLKDSDPEPDAAVARGSIESDSDHPQTALLVIEVSDSSLPLDRKKAFLYAAAGIQEYWIVDVDHRLVEVYRNPVSDKSAPRGSRYPAPSVASPGESLSPWSMQQASLKVADLFA
jgi:Uma2 family endonuclease